MHSHHTAHRLLLLDQGERARVLSPTVLRRIIRDRHPVGFHVPHDTFYILDRKELLDTVDPNTLIPPLHEHLDTFYLLAAPPHYLSQHEQLHLLSRRFFCARLLHNLRRTPQSYQNPLQHLDGPSLDEIRAILLEEDRILPPYTPEGLLEAFALQLLELHHFEPDNVEGFFPTLSSVHALATKLSETTQSASIYHDTRLQDAPPPRTLQRLKAEAHTPPPTPIPLHENTARTRIERASKRGNDVRAAILALRSGASPRPHLHNLGERLSHALGQQGPNPEKWASALAPLLPWASRGLAPPEARLLFDLQRACVERERESLRLDLVGWGISGGEQPAMRPLPGLDLILISRSLKRASSRVPTLHLKADELSALTPLLKEAAQCAQDRLLDRFERPLRDALHDVGIHPQNLPEQIAADKLVAELLDRLVARGFLSLGDLRDAISRNDIKLEDLTDPKSFLAGDELLRLDRLLDRRFEGASRRGEAYMRMLQRLSALAFGTRPGRWITRTLLLPFGGAHVVLEGTQHILSPLLVWMGGSPIHISNLASLAALGTFFLSMLLSPKLRNALYKGYKGVRASFRSIWNLPLLRAIRENRTLKNLARATLPPALPALATGSAMGTFASSWIPGVAVALSVFVAGLTLSQTDLGRAVQEQMVDWTLVQWRFFYHKFLPGLFAYVQEVSKRTIDRLERVLYRVDEWLRFKSTDKRRTLLLKATLGLLWSVASYIVRIYVTLLIEPQVNPIKHFPVVTVSHKIILPFTLQITSLLSAPLKPVVGPVIAGAIVGPTVFLLPGVFGFLVWEFKENWKLYRHNRPRALEPVAFGEHGETMTALLRPGFHSGTLPRLYRKLRQASRNRKGASSSRALRKYREELHHTRDAIQTFLERGIIALWNGASSEILLGVGQIILGPNRIQIELVRTDSPGHSPSRIAFEEHEGWQLASMDEEGWISTLDRESRTRIRALLAGLYKMAGADMTREHLESQIPEDARSKIDERGWVVTIPGSTPSEVVYDLAQPSLLQPQLLRGTHALPSLPRNAAFFDEYELLWDDWVRVWGGDLPPKDLVPGFVIFSTRQEEGRISSEESSRSGATAPGEGSIAGASTGMI